MDLDTLKFNIRYDLYKLNSYSLTDKDIKDLHNYIETLNKNELLKFKEIFEMQLKRKECNGFDGIKITSNAIKLAIKVANETEYRVFPQIEKIATKGWSTLGGSFCFSMFLISVNSPLSHSVFFSDKVRNYVKKSNKLAVGVDYCGNIEISF